MTSRGFSLLELVVAMAVTLALIAGLLAMVRPATAAFSTQMEVADMQQRLRVGFETLAQDLLAVGATMADVAAIRPYRNDGDPPGTVKADTVTLLSMPAAGGPVVPTIYWLKSDDRNAVYQLMSSTAGGPDVPVLDNVVRLAFEYYADPQPPMMLKPLSDPSGPWTTYGPKPETFAVAPYDAGENCVFVADALGGTSSPRLATLGPADGDLVVLSAGQLADGPWCPDEAAADRWDADLLRIRTVGVRLRVESAVAALRGPASVLFVHGGTSDGGHRWAPDLEMHFDISPRNLNLRR